MDYEMTVVSLVISHLLGCDPLVELGDQALVLEDRQKKRIRME